MVAVAAGMLGVGVAARWKVGCLLHAPSCWPHDPFSAEAWAAADPSSRHRLYDDLARSGRLEGLDRPAVEALLGAPDAAGDDKAAGTFAAYRLGASRLGNRYVLDVRFDEAGTVRGYFLRGE